MYPCLASFSDAGVLGSRVSPLARLARDDSRVWGDGRATHSVVIPAERSESRDPCTPVSPLFLMPGYLGPGSRRWRGSPGMTAECGVTAEPLTPLSSRPSAARA